MDKKGGGWAGGRGAGKGWNEGKSKQRVGREEEKI